MEDKAQETLVQEVQSLEERSPAVKKQILNSSTELDQSKSLTANKSSQLVAQVKSTIRTNLSKILLSKLKTYSMGMKLSTKMLEIEAKWRGFIQDSQAVEESSMITK